MKSIDRLREYGARFNNSYDAWSGIGTEILEFADEIEHDVDDMWHALTIDAKPMTDENMAKSGWVRLPVDADGVPIHVGDVMENIVCPSVHREVTGVGVECFYGWDEGNGRYSQFDVVCYRHHHAPTVEDVILDAISRCVGHSPEYWDKPIAECAAKLRLAEDNNSLYEWERDE